MQHVFEKAGLGLAPFKVLRCETRVGPIRMPDGTEVGAPGQPMGTCDYCGTGIKDCYVIRSKDAKEFIVGCDCVLKAGDAGLKREVDAIKREKNRVKREAKRQELERKRWIAVNEFKLTVTDAMLAELEEKPHPMIPGKTLRDYVEFCFGSYLDRQERAVYAMKKHIEEKHIN